MSKKPIKDNPIDVPQNPTTTKTDGGDEENPSKNDLEEEDSKIYRIGVYISLLKSKGNKGISFSAYKKNIYDSMAQKITAEAARYIKKNNFLQYWKWYIKSIPPLEPIILQIQAHSITSVYRQVVKSTKDIILDSLTRIPDINNSNKNVKNLYNKISGTYWENSDILQLLENNSFSVYYKKTLIIVKQELETYLKSRRIESETRLETTYNKTKLDVKILSYDDKLIINLYEKLLLESSKKKTKK